MTATEALAQYQALADKATKGPWLATTSGEDSWDITGVAIDVADRDLDFLIASRTLGPAMAAALQAVSELHYRVGHAYLHVGYECDECGTEWPCPTAAIIAKHLEGK